MGAVAALRLVLHLTFACKGAPHSSSSCAVHLHALPWAAAHYTQGPSHMQQIYRGMQARSQAPELQDRLARR